MSQTVCPNCGNHQPSAAGVGIYCHECGEPIGERGPALTRLHLQINERGRVERCQPEALDTTEQPNPDHGA